MRHSEDANAKRFLRRGILSGLALASVVLLAIVDHDGLMAAAKGTDRAIAGTIGTVTPPALTASFAQRARACDYHWLFFCRLKPEPCMSPLASLCELDVADHDSLWRVLDWDSDATPAPPLLVPAWTIVREGAALPDAVWHALKTRYHQGVVVFGLLVVFIAANSLLAIRTTPAIAWPLTLPVSVVIASGLFWAMQHAFLWAAEGAGVMIELLVLAAFLPDIALFVLKRLRYVRDAAEHLARDAHLGHG